ncbi:MAG: Gfo/Idh/MocA family protein [Eubacterium sp.]
MIRFATIGTNFVVEWFLEGAAKCDDLVYTGTYSRNVDKAREFGKKYGSILFFDNLEKLAESDEIDAVYIASPNSEHFDQAMLMMNHGKHVMVEKTMASNAEQVSILIETARKNKVVLMEAMRPVHDPGFKAIEDAIKEIAPIRRVSFQYCQYSSRYDKFKRGIVENAFDPKFSNGALTDIGVYCVHPLVKLFGEPEEILAQAIILPDSIDGEGTIIAKYDDMLAEVVYSKITDSKVPSQIQGEKGSVIIKEIYNPRQVITYFRNGSVKEADIPQCDLNLEFEAEEWARLICTEDYSDIHSKYSLMALKVMDEARRQQNIVFPADKRNIL